MSSARDFAEDATRSARTIGLEIIAKLLTALQKRTPKVEQDEIVQWFMYSPLVDLHDTTVEITADINIQKTREDLHFGMLKLRKYIPANVMAYDLVHATQGDPMTFNTPKHKLGGCGVLAGNTYIQTTHNTVMNMGTGAFGIAIWLTNVSNATHGISCKKDIAANANAGFDAYITTGSTILIRIADGTNTVLLTASVSPINLNDGEPHSVIINVPASGNLEIFVDKVSKGTVDRGSVANINNSRDHYQFARDNGGTIQDKANMIVSSMVWKKGEVFSSGQRDDWHDKGIVDLDAASDTEVMTFEYDNVDTAMPNAFEGKFIGS